MRLVKGLIGLMVRLAVLPFKIAFALLGTSFRLGAKVSGAPVRVGWRATRAAGVSGVFCFVLGLAIGVLFAPGPGRELRGRLQRRLSGRAGLSDDELADRISFELGHAPRTWHLPQPEVRVSSGRVALLGEVPHDTARDELLRVAGAVPGVSGVDDQLRVETSSPAG